jgi:triosephosphate isomerase
MFAGNWKMHTNQKDAVDLATGILRLLSYVEGVDLVICPPFVYLLDVGDVIRDSSIALGAQDMHWEPQGAFTGEVSAIMLKDVGCKYVIIGHSERRHLLGETDDMVNKKASAALKTGLSPIACVGELLAERERGETLNVLQRQVTACLKGLSAEALGRLVIAYEPVWAIGTGKTATPAQVQEAHAFIRKEISKAAGAAVADGMRILYGGSVKPENAKELKSQADVDGALVGSASLKANSFAGIVKAGTGT